MLQRCVMTALQNTNTYSMDHSTPAMAVSRSRQRSRPQEERNADERNVPHQGANDRHAERIERHICKARCKVERSAPVCAPVMNADQMRSQHSRCKIGKSLVEIHQGAGEPAGDTGERRQELVARARGPSVAAL